jgi:Major Facilitator Superfamily
MSPVSLFDDDGQCSPPLGEDIRQTSSGCPKSCRGVLFDARVVVWLDYNYQERRHHHDRALVVMMMMMVVLVLVAMAVLVVGQSMVQLLSTDDDYESSTNSKRESKNETPDYFMSLMVPLVWFGPILGLLILPRRKYDCLSTDFQDAADDEEFLLKTDGDTKPNIPYTTDVVDDFEDEIDPIGSGSQVATPVLHDFTLRQMLGTTSAWLMLWTCTILVGGGTVMTNNLGQMVQALRFDPKVVPAALSLFSVAQSFGRVMTGSWSSMAKRRTSFLILASVAGFGSHAILAISTELVSFIGGVFLSGLAFGMVWPLMVLITGELFGPSHVGANYMVR